MNALHAQIADLDPEWVKREHRREIRFWVSLGVAILAIAVATWAVVKNGEQDRQITRVEHSACEVDAGGRQCQKTRRESSRAANIATTCIPFFKAGYRCPKPGSPAATRQEQVHLHANPASRLQVGPAGSGHPKGNAVVTPEPGNVGHHGSSGKEPRPSRPPHKTSPSPSPTPTAPSPEPSQPAPAQPTHPEHPAQSPGAEASAPSHPIAEGVGGTVEEVGEAAKGIACGAVETLLPANC